MTGPIFLLLKLRAGLRMRFGVTSFELSPGHLSLPVFNPEMHDAVSHAVVLGQLAVIILGFLPVVTVSKM